MKNLIKLLFAGIVLAGLGTSAVAQSSANTTASVTATLLTNVGITKDVDVTFAQVASGTIPTMDAASATKTNTGGTAALGKFTVTATVGSIIKLTFAAVTLTHSGGVPSGQLTFNTTVAQTPTTADAFGVSPILTGGTYTVSDGIAGGTVAGTDYIFVGGTLNAFGGGAGANLPALGAGQLTGVYTGTLTMTATYN